MPKEHATIFYSLLFFGDEKIQECIRKGRSSGKDKEPLARVSTNGKVRILNAVLPACSWTDVSILDYSAILQLVLLRLFMEEMPSDNL